MYLLHFSGQALWNYMCAPFYFTWPGLQVRDLSVEYSEEGQE